MAQNNAEVYNNTSITSNIYRYRAKGFYVLGQEKFTIDYTNIRSIVIDHDYKSNNMPLIYIILNLSTKIIDKVISNKDTGVFIISIQKCVDNSDLPDLWIDYISDTFLYFLTEDINKTDKRDYENENEGRDDIYKEITVGLLSQNLVNHNKKTVNGILRANDMMSAVSYVAGNGRPMVVEPFENNNSIRNLFLPPKTSVAKSIEYLNGIKVFYNTPYIYYMDFDVSYLLSSRGRQVPKKGDKINTVMIVLRNDYDMSARIQGMSINESNKYYYIEIGAGNAEVADFKERSKSYTTLRYTNTAGKNSDMQVTKVNSNSNFVSKTSHVRAPNDNPGLLTNARRTSEFYMSITKTDLDASVFTPNKEYIINAEDVYDKSYSGRYLLRRKRELFFKSTGNTADDKLTLSTLLFFEKVYE